MRMVYTVLLLVGILLAFGYFAGQVFASPQPILQVIQK